RIAEALNEVGRETKTVLLHRREVGRACKRGIERGRGESAKVKETCEIQLEDRFGYSDECGVTAEFEVMVSGDDVYVVSKLVPRFGANDRREELAADEGRAGNVES